MKRISIISMVLIFSLFVSGANCPSNSEFRSILLSAINDYLSNPSTTLTYDEVRDLFSFYVLKNLSGSNTNCNENWEYSGESINYILAKAGETCTLEVTNYKQYPNPASSQATFEAIGQGIEQIKVKIYDLNSNLLFDSGWQSGSTYTWNLKDSNGKDVANGAYAYKISVTGCGEQEESSAATFQVSRSAATTTTTTTVPQGDICVDSDNGKNYDVKGTCTSPNGYPGTDYCKDWGMVHEYYCQDQGTCWFIDDQCPEVCRDGVCASSATTTTTTTIPTGVYRCVDTDGEDKYTKGKVTIYKPDGSVASNVNDYCTSSLGAVYERYCIKEYGEKGDTLGDTKTLQCDPGEACSDGACARVNVGNYTCTDSDKGSDKYTKGFVTVYNPSGSVNTYVYDDCTILNGILKLKEYNCPTSSSQYLIDPAIVYMNCPTGYSCSNGACKSSSATTTTTVGSYTCTDSDKGSDQYIKGYVVVNKPDGSLYKQESDKCSGSLKLKEYNCPTASSQSPINPTYIEWGCENGCSNGACKKSSSSQEIAFENEVSSCESECVSRGYLNNECSLIPCFFLGKTSIGQQDCGFLQSCCCS